MRAWTEKSTPSMKETVKGEKACLLLHGFTGGPFEVEPLAVALTRSGWHCRVPTLPGHGGHPMQLRHVGYTDWLRAAEEEAEALVRRYGQLDCVGFSMGGMLAAGLASRYPIRRLVLLNAAAIYFSPLRFAAEVGERLRKKLPPAAHKIGETPWQAAVQFMLLVRRMKATLSRVSCPALIVQGMRDPVVHPGSARYLAERLGGRPEVCYFNQSKHMICLDCEAEDVFQRVSDFLSQA